MFLIELFGIIKEGLGLRFRNITGPVTLDSLTTSKCILVHRIYLLLCFRLCTYLKWFTSI